MGALVRYLRCGLVALAVAAALISIFLALTSLPEPERNPASSDFGWLQWQWAVACLGATVVLAAAILATSGWTRRLLIVVLLANWGFGVAPGLQIYRYRLGCNAPLTRIADAYPHPPRSLTFARHPLPRGERERTRVAPPHTRRHARTCCGHPRLLLSQNKTSMAGTSPAMTSFPLLSRPRREAPRAGTHIPQPTSASS